MGSAPIKTAINEKALDKTIKLCRERKILIPAFEQLKDPSLIPQPMLEKIRRAGMDDLNPANLFRITWRNDIKTGLFGDVNFLEIPQCITGVRARIIGLAGKYFPTGAHKVGAAFGCLAPRLVSGEFDPASQKAVWPSTGNYCRGGAFDSRLLGCAAIAILPEGMSRERFDWLKSIGAEIIATPGTESNVKEIYDKCKEIRQTRKDCVIFNQFEEFGNAVWHYVCTGSALEEVFKSVKGKKSRLSAYVSATGSAGTIAAGDYLKKKFPEVKIAACEALQCPTLLLNGFGEHRIEGIGDKHVPWIHNVRNTDMVIAVDDENCMRALRLFNEEAGKKILAREGVKEEIIEKLPLLGISGIANMLSAVKTAKYYEMDENDVIFTVFTDSAHMYKSRLAEMEEKYGKYTQENACADIERYVRGVSVDYLKELDYNGRKAVHNLKYFTWVEQQGKTSQELRRLWEPDFWDETFERVKEWDKLIAEFNRAVGPV